MLRLAMGIVFLLVGTANLVLLATGRIPRRRPDGDTIWDREEQKTARVMLRVVGVGQILIGVVFIVQGLRGE